MSVRFRALLARLGVVMALLLGSLAVTTPTPAMATPGDPAYLTSGLYGLPPRVPVTDPVCVDRTLNLAAGTYRWEAGWVSGTTVRRTIDRTWRLGSSSYSWNVCLDPIAAYGNDYVMYSELDPSYGAWRTVRVVSRGFTLPRGVYQTYSKLTPLVFE